MMRPSADRQRLRSVGRIVAVAVGAASPSGWHAPNPAAVTHGGAVLLAVAGAAGNHGSRW